MGKLHPYNEDHGITEISIINFHESVIKEIRFLLQVNWEVECNKAKSNRWLNYYFKRGTVYTQCKIYTYTCSKDISEN